MCAKCKATWLHPSNLIGREFSLIGEYTLNWKCPNCGHVIVYYGAPGARAP